MSTSFEKPVLVWDTLWEGLSARVYLYMAMTRHCKLILGHLPTAAEQGSRFPALSVAQGRRQDLCLGTAGVPVAKCSMAHWSVMVRACMVPPLVLLLGQMADVTLALAGAVQAVSG